MPLPLLIPIISALAGTSLYTQIVKANAGATMQGTSPAQGALQAFLTTQPFPQTEFNLIANTPPFAFWDTPYFPVPANVIKAEFDTIYKDNNGLSIQTQITQDTLYVASMKFQNWLNNYKAILSKWNLTDSNLNKLQAISDIGFYQFVSNIYPYIESGFSGISFGESPQQKQMDEINKWFLDYNSWASGKGYPTWAESDSNPFTKYVVTALNIAIPGSGTLIYSLATKKFTSSDITAGAALVNAV